MGHMEFDIQRQHLNEWAKCSGTPIKQQQQTPFHQILIRSWQKSPSFTAVCVCAFFSCHLSFFLSFCCNPNTATMKDSLQVTACVTLCNKLKINGGEKKLCRARAPACLRSGSHHSLKSSGYEPS